MASDLLGQYRAAGSFDLQDRVEMALRQTAQAIAVEAAATPDHGNRVALAHSIVLNPSPYVGPFTFLLTSQGIDSTSTDAAIINMVSAVWNTVSG